MNALFIDINFSVQFTKVDLTMKILVLDAGVLVCNLTRNLFRAGKDVTLLARGKWAEEIQKNGQRIKDKFSPRTPVTRISVVTELNPKRAIGCGSLSSCAICKSTRFRMHCVRTRPKTSFLSAIMCVQEQLPLHSRKNRAVCLLSFRRALGSWPCGVRAAKQTAIYKTQGQHRLAFCVFFKFICATELERDALRYFRQANWSLPHISNCHHLLPISFAKPLYGQKRSLQHHLL